MNLVWRLLRAAALGIAIGLLLAEFLERNPTGMNTSTAIGIVVLLIAGMGLHRWLAFRRERERRQRESDGR